jgi:hypothetical protein
MTRLLLQARQNTVNAAMDALSPIRGLVWHLPYLPALHLHIAYAMNIFQR